MTLNQYAWYQFHTLKDCLRNSKEWGIDSVQRQCTKQKIPYGSIMKNETKYRVRRQPTVYI